MRIIILVLIVVFISGCDVLKSHSRWALENKDYLCSTLCTQPIDSETNVSNKDTIYSIEDLSYLPVDSMLLMLMFDCDSNRNVILNSSEVLRAKNGKLLFELNKGKLTIKALMDSIEIKNKTIYNTKTQTITITKKVPVYVPKVEYRVPWWVYFTFGVGGVIIVYLLIRKIVI